MSSKLFVLAFMIAAQFNQPQSDTEWWYYTGNLQSADGHRYGYELTFFRQVNKDAPKSDSVWNPNQLFLAHAALSDIDGRKFEHLERLNRAGPGIAGVIWNGNWEARWISEAGEQQLEAVTLDFTLHLQLEPAKPFVTNGVDGIDRKGPLKDEFSQYVSFTRLQSSGTLVRDGKTIALTGTSWMDHENFNDVEDPELEGWEWFAIQLDNDEELLLYRLRLKSGKVSPYSSGTFVDAAGHARHLTEKDFNLTARGYWDKYPVNWHVSVPSLGVELDESTQLQNQELYTPNSVSPAYWEGAVEYRGTAHGRAVRGVGYLELTGYKGALRLGH